VSVSDGSGFRTESYYRSKDGAAIRHLDDSDRIVAVEGPIGWASDGEKSAMGSDFYKLFALGHQYHALLLDFDDIAANVREDSQVEFAGEMRTAASGDYPYGGTVHLVRGGDASRPAGLRFDFPDDAVIVASFLDWREADDRMLPYRVRVDDGERIFDYRYTSISIAPGSPFWFFDAVPAPSIDQLQIYRLHRKLLAAHCTGDAGMIAALSAPSVYSVNRGRLDIATNADLETRFTSLFDALEYSEYVDLSDPVIEVSGEVGWIAVNTRAAGAEKNSGRLFEDQWAWIMTARKIDGHWLHTANASNRQE
jgi:ketosteroid isomerase-like protein